MLIFEKTNDLIQFRKNQQSGTIGFVPTMGALHQGHLKLVRQSKKQTHFTYVSIFVNPLQFNDKNDLEKYPRTIDKDIQLLESVDADALFLPSFEEVYQSGITYDEIDLTYLNSILEGPKRPGHFEGVVKVVSILFKIIQPHKAFFGLKDFQQVKVIEQLVKQKQYPIEIIPCPTVREKDGLAMSSRNTRLSPEARQKAPQIYQWLLKAKKLYEQNYPIQEIENTIIQEIQQDKNFTLDYFEIRDTKDLSQITSPQQKPVALIAVFLNGIRLIDNLELA
ncbi:MAG: pantoate--beta-alanine ligase [Bacteroidia bacterium]|nr:pantoate--beta-alanine ligase [Bacteroidia bacterium]